jgi:type I restriction enzyme S subunit
MNDEKLIPKLRFASYSNEWESHKLSDILTFYSTNSFSREKLNYESGNVKNIHYGDIHTKFPTILSISGNKDVPFINADIDLSKYNDDQYLQEGDLIIADASEDYADIGKAIEVKDINNEKVLAGLHTILARDEKNITINGFKGYLFLTEDLKTNIKRIANGISVLGISKNNLSKLMVNIPNTEEQQDIVKFMSAIDKKIELLEKKYANYQEFKKYLMQQIFAQKLRFDNFDSEWEFKKLGEVSNVKDGTHDSPKYVSNGYPLITSKNLVNGKIDFKNVNYISKEDYDNINKRSNVNKGDILFGMIGTIGNPLIAETDEFAIKNVALIKEKKELVNKFLIHIFETDFINKQFYRLNAGGTQKFIALGLIKDLLVPIPPIEEQLKISEFLSMVDINLNSSKNQISNMKKFKKGLLQQMFI